MNKKEKLQIEKKKIASLPRFKGKCYVCWKKFGKYFLFHHLYYIDNEPYHADYKDNIEYQMAVLPYVKSNPKQFLLLCRVHHHFLEWGKKIGDDKFKRFCKARRMSK